MTPKQLVADIRHANEVTSGYANDGVIPRHNKSSRRGAKHVLFAMDFAKRFPVGSELADEELDGWLFEYADRGAANFGGQGQRAKGHMACCASKGRPCKPEDDSWAQHIQNRNYARSKINIGAVAEHVPTENRFQVDVATRPDGVARHGYYLVQPNIDSFDADVRRLGKRWESLLRTQYDNIHQKAPALGEFDGENPVELLRRQAIVGHLNALRDAGRAMATTLSNLENQVAESKKLMSASDHLASLNYNPIPQISAGNVTGVSRLIEGQGDAPAEAVESQS